jgi:ribosomal protein S18 acetylase RimI-like enzyme
LIKRNSGAEILAVESGDELMQAWREAGFSPAGGEEAMPMWAEVVGKGRHDFIIARLGNKAVGSVLVKRDGPVELEKGIFETALKDAFPEEQPIPVIYSWYVHPAHRENYVGRDLLDAAEQSIANRQGAVARSALWVACDNLDAVPRFVKSGYDFLRYRGSFGVVLDRPASDKVHSSTEPVYMMTKDLSHLRKTGVE